MNKEGGEMSYKEEYCCLDLVRAVKAEWLDEVVSGIFFRNKDTSSCKSNIPRLVYCPFCGAKIKCKQVENGWIWWTEKQR